MSHKLIERNEDLLRLRQKGYNIDIHAAHLIVRDIPYVDDQKHVHMDGILVTELELDGDITRRPNRHQMRFSGKCPCDVNGVQLNVIRPNSQELRISEKLITQFEFSNKPQSGYSDYFDKVKTYAAIISSPAAALDPSVTFLTKKVVEPEEDESPFNYLDTASARAEINVITAKLAVEKVAIVGLGGTGAYVLDLISKTPVGEIHLFDGDKFSSHNAFRAPGAPSLDELRSQLLKVEYFQSIYSRMHRGVVIHDEYIDEGNVSELPEMSSVFLCMDSGPSKRLIVNALEKTSVPFIDVGMGLYVNDETIGGSLRVLLSSADFRDRARNRMSLADEDEPNEYDKNIQIADLNALNAVLAVIRWKKLRGFYFDFKKADLNIYTIGTNQLLSEDLHDQDT